MKFLPNHFSKIFIIVDIQRGKLDPIDRISSITCTLRYVLHLVTLKYLYVYYRHFFLTIQLSLKMTKNEIELKMWELK